MLPDYIIRAYKEIPQDCPVTVLIRHSIRYPINSEAEIWTAGLTKEGKELAIELGTWLNQDYTIKRIESSPIFRCVETGRFISSALTDSVDVFPVDVLAHPNENGEYDSFDEYFPTSKWPNRIQEIAAYLVQNGYHKNGLNLFISHDTTLVTMVGYWLQKDFRDLSIWPNYLEPFFLWWQDDQLISRFRDEQIVVNHVLEQQPISSLYLPRTENKN